MHRELVSVTDIDHLFSPDSIIITVFYCLYKSNGFRVGKLTENRLKIGQDELEEEERASAVSPSARVGKLSEDRLKIGQDNLADDTEADMVNRVGKLSVDRQVCVDFKRVVEKLHSKY